jgi:hypothetical protein
MRLPARVTEVQYLDGHRLLIEFKDGSRKIFDMQRNIEKGGIFGPLQNIKYFKMVRVNPAAETIEWPNGADICPDTLYNDGVDAGVEAIR